MAVLHWNYFLALEDDVDKLARYIEFDEKNMGTYSIEIARILMLATQEVDVLAKQICLKHQNKSDNEQGYREFIIKKYPKMLELEVGIPRYYIVIKPFEDWGKNKTPEWWTANNKIKHKRNENFSKASLVNMLEALSALLLMNIYFYLEIEDPRRLYPNPKLLYPGGLVKGITPNTMGNLNVYKLP